MFFFKPISPGCERLCSTKNGQKGCVKSLLPRARNTKKPHTPRSEVWFQNQLRSGLHGYWMLRLLFFLFFFDMMMIPANDYGHSSRSCIIQEHAWKICRIETDFSMFGITCENPDFLQDWIFDTSRLHRNHGSGKWCPERLGAIFHNSKACLEETPTLRGKHIPLIQRCFLKVSTKVSMLRATQTAPQRPLKGTYLANDFTTDLTFLKWFCLYGKVTPKMASYKFGWWNIQV